MKEPKRQHWVPRLYLSAFATPETVGDEYPKVWCFHKDTGDPFCTSIANVAVEQYLYSPAADDGKRSFELERKLADLEDTVAPLWRALATGEIDFSDEGTRKIIALFAATLFLRNPQRIADRRFLYATNVVEWEALQAQMAMRLGLPTDATSRTQQSVDQVERELAVSQSTTKELTATFLEFIERDARPLAERLVKKRWCLVKATVPIFATSDNPFILGTQDPVLRGLHLMEGLITLPVSPTIALVMDDRLDQPDNCMYPLNPGVGESLNATVFRQALRFLISSQPSDEILAGIVSQADGAPTIISPKV